MSIKIAQLIAQLLFSLASAVTRYLDIWNFVSGQNHQIQLILFGLSQVSQETSLEYYHRVVWRNLKAL
jgi:hypothetical protein